MGDSNDFLIDKLMEFITEENIDEKLLFYSSILERLMNKKECMDINVNTSVRHRACKKPMKKLKLEFLEMVSDEDSSSDYLPSEIESDSDNDNEDDDEDEDDE
jgi:4-hydroxyphenylpyruvate dioxygenase-like putative hemolysin